MKCVVMAYFKDERGAWHQPGNAEEFTQDEYERNRKHLKIIQTRMVEQAVTRIETALRGRKRR